MEIAARIGTMARSGGNADCYGLDDDYYIPEIFDPGNSPFEACFNVTMGPDWSTLKTIHYYLTKGNALAGPLMISLASNNRLFFEFYSDDSTRFAYFMRNPTDGENIEVKLSFDGQGAYDIFERVDGVFVLRKHTVSSNHVYPSRLRLMKSSNSGWSWYPTGSHDLTRCYIKIGDRLFWEGVKGAYDVVSNEGGY